MNDTLQPTVVEDEQLNVEVVHFQALPAKYRGYRNDGVAKYIDTIDPVQGKTATLAETGDWIIFDRHNNVQVYKPVDVQETLQRVALTPRAVEDSPALAAPVSVEPVSAPAPAPAPEAVVTQPEPQLTPEQGSEIAASRTLEESMRELLGIYQVPEEHAAALAAAVAASDLVASE